MSNPTCETCRWWARVFYGNLGQCRVAPPRVIAGESDEDFRGVRPETESGDFCGEHAPREEGEWLPYAPPAGSVGEWFIEFDPIKKERDTLRLVRVTESVEMLGGQLRGCDASSDCLYYWSAPVSVPRLPPDGEDPAPGPS